MPIVTEIDGLVDADHRQRARVVGVGERLADRDVGDAGDGDDVAGPGLLGVDAVERLGDVELGDLRARSIVPSARHQAISWPRRIVPWCTRHSARRPR